VICLNLKLYQTLFLNRPVTKLLVTQKLVGPQAGRDRYATKKRKLAVLQNLAGVRKGKKWEIGETLPIPFRVLPPTSPLHRTYHAVFGIFFYAVCNSNVTTLTTIWWNPKVSFLKWKRRLSSYLKICSLFNMVYYIFLSLSAFVIYIV